MWAGSAANRSQIDSPLPSASHAPSIWWAAVAVPQTNPAGNSRNVSLVMMLAPGSDRRSLLDRAGGRAGHDVLAEQQVERQRRHRDDHHAGELHGVVGAVLALEPDDRERQRA